MKAREVLCKTLAEWYDVPDWPLDAYAVAS